MFRAPRSAPWTGGARTIAIFTTITTIAAIAAIAAGALNPCSPASPPDEQGSHERKHRARGLTFEPPFTVAIEGIAGRDHTTLTLTIDITQERAIPVVIRLDLPDGARLLPGGSGLVETVESPPRGLLQLRWRVAGLSASGPPASISVSQQGTDAGATAHAQWPAAARAPEAPPVFHTVPSRSVGGLTIRQAIPLTPDGDDALRTPP